MKLVMVTGRFPRPSETFIVRKAVGLLDRGHDVHVVAHTLDHDLLAKHFGATTAKRLRGRLHLWPGLRSPLAASRSLPRLPRMVSSEALSAPGIWARRALRTALLARLDADVVHYEFGHLAAHQIPITDHGRARVTVSLRADDISGYGLGSPRDYQRVWAVVSAVHCVSADIWRRALESGCPASMPHAVVHGGVDTSFFTASGAPPPGRRGAARPTRLLSVGRLHWKKGYEYALLADRLLLDRGIALEHRIVGEGPHRPAVEVAIRDLGLRSSVTLTGLLSPTEVRDELARADVFVHAAVSEGFANAALEAQATGLPVVAAAAEGLSENIEHGVTGMIVPTRDASALAEAIAALALDPARRQAMGHRGRRRAEELFSLDRQIEQLDRFYAGVLAPGA